MKDLVDNYGHTISDLEASLKQKEEEFGEQLCHLRDEQEINQELMGQIKMFQQE